MKSFYKFQKSTLPGKGGGTDSTTSTVTKKTMFFSVFKRLLPMVVLLLLSTNGFSQTGWFNIWNNEWGKGLLQSNEIYGCGISITREDDEIKPTYCLIACKNSTIEYNLNENYVSYYAEYIESVKWTIISGGTLANNPTAPHHPGIINWGNSSYGGILIKITFNNNFPPQHFWFCVRLVNGPTAAFEIFSPGDNEFCQGSSILFDNQSTGMSNRTTYLWDFGDDNFSTEFEPEHAYDLPGTYEVTLTVTNRCGCSSTITHEVTVTAGESQIIWCPGVVIENAQATYHVIEACGGDWIVDGGTILSGGDGFDFVEVEWDDVDPVEGFGYVSYRSSCECSAWTTVKIPVITSDSVIQGDAVICMGEQKLYSLPQWPSTQFSWTTSGGISIPTNQRNEILIEGETPGTYTLSCTYYNTLLNYGDTVDITITVSKEVVIEGPTDFCSNSGVKTYTNTENIPLNWVLTHNGTTITSYNGINFNHNFTSGGTYMLTASALDTGCFGDPIAINVTPTPETPTGTIIGSKMVCTGVSYQYSYENNEPDTILAWETTGTAAIQGANTGNSVNIVFSGTGPYEVKVKRRSLVNLDCESGWLTETITIVDEDLFDIVNDDDEYIFCPSSETSFTADLGGFLSDDIKWEILPANFGNIIGGVNGQQVTVNWNEISDSPNGTLRMTVTYCGLTEVVDKPVSLYQLPGISMLPLDDVCPGDENITVTVNTTNLESAESVYLIFQFENQDPLPPVAINELSPGSSTYTIPNGFTNSGASNISQGLTVTIDYDCLYNPSATINAIVFPETIINISPGYDINICNATYDHELISNISTGITLSTGFQWYKDEVAIPGATSENYFINNTNQPVPAGVYYVRVKDDNDCYVNSNNIYVTQNCGSGGSEECELSFEPDVTLTAEWDCDVINAQIVFNDVPSIPQSIFWVEEGYLLLDGEQGTPNATFTTNVPAAHRVQVVLHYGEGCRVVRHLIITKNYEPKMSIEAVCDINNAAYDVTLHNHSTVFEAGAYTITYSGPGITGSPTGDSHLITGVAPGTYTYTLTITSPGKPSCSVERTITLGAMPDVDFPLSILEYCSEEVINLFVPNYNPAYTYSWWFEGTHIYASGPTTQINMTPGEDKGITLKAKTAQGCEIESDEIEVKILAVENFEGEFSETQINACEGDDVPTIFFNNTGTNSPSEIIWMRGDEVIPGATGNSYTPTESGSYWVLLLDDKECENRSMVEQAVNVSIRKRPEISITGMPELCFEETTVLKGNLTDPTLERRWLLDNAVIHGWSTSTPLNLEVEGTSPGNFKYTFEVRPAGDVSCGSTVDFMLKVHYPLIEPELEYTVTCSPYTVTLSVTNVQTGDYQWSNGANGTSINVTAGGVYQVTYTAPTGCQITADIIAPHNPQEAMWTFPRGCFDICVWDTLPAPYITGPLGTFEGHQWVVNGVIEDSGIDSPIFNLPVNQAGAYQLFIEQDSCDYSSGIAYITPDKVECEVDDCGGLIPNLQLFEYLGEYGLSGTIRNNYGIAVTVTISSLNGYGTYDPASFNIPPSGLFPFSLNSFFTPHPGSYGGDDFVVISIAEIPCITLIPVSIVVPSSAKMMAEDTTLEEYGTIASLKVTPNPASELIAVSFDIGTEYHKAESVRIYTMTGTMAAEIDLKANKGDLPLNISNFPAGTYIVTLQADGRTVLHQKLIKK